MACSTLFTYLQGCLSDAARDLPRADAPLPDLNTLSPEELGSLWPAAYQQRNNFAQPQQRALAAAILEQGRRRTRPALDDAAAVAVFRQIRSWDEGVEHLAWLTQAPSAELSALLMRLLAGDEERALDDEYWARHRYKAFCLCHYANEASRSRLRQAVVRYCDDSPWTLREFELLPALEFSNVLMLALAQTAYYHPREQETFQDPARLLGEEPAYVALAGEILAQAAQRLDDIQQGTLPYVADGAFSVEDAHVIARLARVAAWRGEAESVGLIVRLLPGCVVAPGATAKTLPSQSLAVALGHAVEGVPTPEGVQALRTALEKVRHAGIKKKLARNLKPAERGLAQRADMALRLSESLPAGKRSQGMLAVCLEAMFWQPTTFSAEQWRARLLDSAAGSALARALIWSLQRPGTAARSFMPARNGELLGIDGRPLTLTAQDSVTLWHPLGADAPEREAWQTRILARRIAQPFRQALREYYLYNAHAAGFHAATFAGFQLALRPLLGLAVNEGWRIGDGWDAGVLLRRFGAFRAGFTVHARLYPGVAGWGESGELSFWRQEACAWERVMPDQLPAQVFSEICRAVDLLVSRAGIGLAAADDASFPAGSREKHLRYLSETGGIAAQRREVIAHLFAEAVAAGHLCITGNRAEIGDYSVNLATGRTTRAGAPAEITLAEKAEKTPLFWLPYEETLLRQLCATLNELLSRTY